MELLMHVTAEELNRALGGSRAHVRLGTEVDLRKEMPNEKDLRKEGDAL